MILAEGKGHMPHRLHWFSSGRHGLGIIPVNRFGRSAIILCFGGLLATAWIGGRNIEGVVEWCAMIVPLMAQVGFFFVVVLLTFDPAPPGAREVLPYTPGAKVMSGMRAALVDATLRLTNREGEIHEFALSSTAVQDLLKHLESSIGESDMPATAEKGGSMSPAARPAVLDESAKAAIAEIPTGLFGSIRRPRRGGACGR
jgi:hypothetical protein